MSVDNPRHLMLALEYIEANKLVLGGSHNNSSNVYLYSVHLNVHVVGEPDSMKLIGRGETITEAVSKFQQTLREYAATQEQLHEAKMGFVMKMLGALLPELGGGA